MKNCVATCLITLLSFTVNAAPADKAEWSTKGPKAERERPELTLDVRLLGGPLGTFIDEPSEADKLKTLPNGEQERLH